MGSSPSIGWDCYYKYYKVKIKRFLLNAKSKWPQWPHQNIRDTGGNVYVSISMIACILEMNEITHLYLRREKTKRTNARRELETWTLGEDGKWVPTNTVTSNGQESRRGKNQCSRKQKRAEFQNGLGSQYFQISQRDWTRWRLKSASTEFGRVEIVHGPHDNSWPQCRFQCVDIREDINIVRGDNFLKVYGKDKRNQGGGLKGMWSIIEVFI